MLDKYSAGPLENLMNGLGLNPKSGSSILTRKLGAKKQQAAENDFSIPDFGLPSEEQITNLNLPDFGLLTDLESQEEETEETPEQNDEPLEEPVEPDEEEAPPIPPVVPETKGKVPVYGKPPTSPDPKVPPTPPVGKVPVYTKTTPKPQEPPKKPEPVPTPKPQEAKPKLELPKWLDPSWLGEQKSNKSKGISGIDFSSIELPEGKFFDLPRRNLKKFNVDTIDGAEKFLLSLSNTSNEIRDTCEAIENVNEHILLDNNQKNKADALGFAIGKLKSLIQRATSIFTDRDRKDGIKASETLVSHFSLEVSKVPKELQERLNKQVDKQLKTTKARPLQEFKSRYLAKWNGIDLTFVRSRAIMIMADQGITREEAESAAHEEWDKMVFMVNDTAPNLDDNKKREAIKMFATQVLGGSPLDVCWSVVQKFIKAGGSSSTDRFKHVEFDEDDLGSMIDDLLDEERIDNNLEDLPKDIAGKIKSDLIMFGRLCKGFYEITRFWTDEHSITDEDLDAAQTLSDKIAAIGSSIMLTDPKYMDQASTLFEETYWVFKEISKITKEHTLGLSNLEEVVGLDAVSELSGGEEGDQKSTGIGVIAPTKKGPGGKPRNRKKEIEEKAKENYMRRLRAHGDIESYLNERRTRHQEKTPEQRNLSRELDRLRSPDYKYNARELVFWTNMLMKPGSWTKDIAKINKFNASRTLELFNRIRESWLSPEQIKSDVIDTLIKRRERTLGELYSKAKGDPSTNQSVLSALEEHIKKIPEFFHVADQQTQNIVHPKFTPGQGSRRPDQRPMPKQIVWDKISRIRQMVNALIKYANANQHVPTF